MTASESGSPDSGAPDSRNERPRPAADLALVAQALESEGEARDRLLDRLRCVPRMLAAKNAQLGRPLDETELQDLVQETLVAVWRKLPEYSGLAALETWVYRFCFLELMYRLRSMRRLPRLLEDLGEDVAGRQPAPRDPSPLDYEDVYRALDGLEPDESQVVRLKHFQGLTFEAIGAELDLSPNTVKRRYYRGLLKLRRRMGSLTPREGSEEAAR